MACAVALANIAIIEKEDMVENAADVGQYLNARLRELAEHHHLVLGIRSLGMLAAFDVDGEQVTGSAQTAAQAGSILTAALTEAGVLVRPYGNTIAFGPAISTTEADVDAIFERFDATLARLQR